MSVGSIYIYGTDSEVDESLIDLITDSNGEVDKSRLDAMVTAGSAIKVEANILNDNFNILDESEYYDSANGKIRLTKQRREYNVVGGKKVYPTDLTEIRAFEAVSHYDIHYIGVNDYIGLDDIVTVNTKVYRVVLTSISRSEPVPGWRQIEMKLEGVKSI